MASAGNPRHGSPEHPAERQAGSPGTTAGAGSGTLQDTAQGLAASARAGAGAAWDQTVHGAQGAGAFVAGTADDAWGELTRLLRRYPLASIAAGAAVGFLLARLLDPTGGRRSSATLYYPGDRTGRDVYPYAK